MDQQPPQDHCSPQEPPSDKPPELPGASAPKQAKAVSPISTTFFIIGLIFVTLIILDKSLNDLKKNLDLGYNLGGHIATALIYWIIFYFIFAHKRSGTRAWVSALIFFLVPIPLMIMADIRRSESHTAVAELNETTSKMLHALGESMEGTGTVNLKMDMTIKASGPNAEIERFMKELYARLISLRNGYAKVV